MIWVTRINKLMFMINPDLIETIEETPDTVVTMQSGHKLVVTESAELIRELIIEYKRNLHLQHREGFGNSARARQELE